MFSKYGEFYFFARAIISLITFYFSLFCRFGICMLYYVYFVIVEYYFSQLKIANCCTIAQLSQV